MTDFTTKFRGERDIVKRIQNRIIKDVLNAFPQINTEEDDDLMDILYSISESTGDRFVMIIDEWDAILREMGTDENITIAYVDLLRRLFKGSGSNDVFAGAYLTGILPIKRYNTESALNNFNEYSMIDPAYLAPCFGFTKDEVQALARQHNASMEELKMWYDGYTIGREKSIYNPYSVIKALQRGVCKSYWTTTGAYDSVIT